MTELNTDNYEQIFMATLSKTKLSTGYVFKLGFTTQVNTKTAVTGTQILQAWWSPKWATATNVYANYICQFTQSNSGGTYRNEVWSTSLDITVDNNAKASPATFTGTQVTGQTQVSKYYAATGDELGWYAFYCAGEREVGKTVAGLTDIAMNG
jgi:hypothetical protein